MLARAIDAVGRRPFRERILAGMTLATPAGAGREGASAGGGGRTG